jgi:myosin heavy subunit
MAQAAADAPGGDIRQLTQITEQLSKSKQLRNYFQLERDAIHKYWQNTVKELDASKNELLMREHEMEDAEKRHQVEMKVYKQKVRHLLYEHKVQVQALTESAENALAESTDQHKDAISQLKKDKRGNKQDLKDLMNDHEEEVKTMRQEHRRLLTVNRTDADKTMAEMGKKYDQKIKLLRDELELRRHAEIHDIEGRKNAHIRELMAKHEASFQEMKEYYNDITSNNLDLIKSLKEEVANMGKNQLYNEKLMFDIAQENKRLNEPLQKAKKEVETLRHELANYEKDKMSLKNTKSRLLSLEEQLRKLEAAHKEKQEAFERLIAQKETLVANYEQSLRDVRTRAGFKNQRLEQRLDDANQRLDEKDAQLAAVLQAANLEPTALELVTRKLEDMLETKNRAIKDLHFELAKVEQQHGDVLKAYEGKCQAASIPILPQFARAQAMRTEAFPVMGEPA